MIKLVIFDLDGVLIDSKQTHYEALNRALGDEYAITIEEHLSTPMTALPCSNLTCYSERKGRLCLPTQIGRAKQRHTVDILKETVTPRTDFVDMCREIKDRGYTLVCASNAVSRYCEDEFVTTGYNRIPYLDK